VAVLASTVLNFG